VERALTLGTALPGQPDLRWKASRDPAGHPSCLTPIPELGGLTDACQSSARRLCAHR